MRVGLVGAGGMTQIDAFNVVEELDGKFVKLPGFTLPFEWDATGDIREFLLVPYFGACIHTPPPPPNQMVYVTTDEPVDFVGMWDPVWVIGELRTSSNMNDLGNTAYTLELVGWEAYE